MNTDLNAGLVQGSEPYSIPAFMVSLKAMYLTLFIVDCVGKQLESGEACRRSKSSLVQLVGKGTRGTLDIL